MMGSRPMGPAARRGTVLLVVLAILGVISAMAVAFARLMMVERDASGVYADTVQARLLAAAGVEHGGALVGELLATKPYLTSKDGFAYPCAPGVRLSDATDVSLEVGEPLQWLGRTVIG